MKRLLILLSLALLPSAAWAYTETFYLCATGDGSAPEDGTCAHAWDAADFNTAGNWDTDDQDDGKLGPNDLLIMLDDGGVYRTAMTAQQPGLSGKPITIQGESGGSATINGADLVTTWTAVSTSGTLWNVDLNANSANPYDYDNMRQLMPAAVIPNNASEVRIQVEAHSTTDDEVISGASICERSGATRNCVTTPTRITWDTGNNGKTVGAGTTAYSDWITFSVDETKDYLIHIYRSAAQRVRYFAAGNTHYMVKSLSDETLSATLSGAETSTNAAVVQLLEGRTGGANQWQAAYADGDPSQVFFDTSLGTEEGTCPSGLNASSEWCWAANVLYAYSTSDPDSTYTSPGIEATSGSANGLVIPKSYVTVTGLTSKFNGGGGFYVKPAAAASLSNVTVQNCTASYNVNGGFGVANNTGETVQTVSDVTFDSNTADHNGSAGIAVSLFVQASTISNNTVHDNGWIPSGTSYGWHGISTYGSSSTVRPTQITIEGNTVYNQQDCPACTSEEGAGIQGDDNSDYLTIRRNYVHDNEGSGIVLNLDDHCVVSYNLIINNGDANAPPGGEGGIFQVDGQFNSYYNNTIYGNDDFGFYAYDDYGLITTDTTLKNNILMDNGTLEIRVYKDGAAADATTNWVSDYDLLFHTAGGSFLQWNDEAPETFAGWQADGHDTHGVSSDPLFLGVSDFRLQPTSLAINAGTDVGLTSDYLSHHVPFGSAPDIGAYEWGGAGLRRLGARRSHSGFVLPGEMFRLGP